MDLFSEIGKEWELLKKEVQELRKENNALSGQMAAMSRQNDKEMRSLRKECDIIKAQNAETLDDVDKLRCNNAALMAELADMKRLFNREMRKAKQNDQTFESLKRVFNQALVSGQDKKEQLDQLRTEIETLKKQSSPAPHQMAISHSSLSSASNPISGPSGRQTTNTQSSLSTASNPISGPSGRQTTNTQSNLSSASNPISGPSGRQTTNTQSSFSPASSPISSPSGRQTTNTQSSLSSTYSTTDSFTVIYSSTIGPSASSVNTPPSEQLKPEDKKSLIKRCKFYLQVATPRPIHSMEIVRVDKYDQVDLSSVFMNQTTGVFTAPAKGTYEFDVWINVYGKGVVSCFVCRGDGKRILVGERRDGDGGGVRSSVYRNCLKDMKVWLEVKGGTVGDQTRFQAGFRGRLL